MHVRRSSSSSAASGGGWRKSRWINKCTPQRAPLEAGTLGAYAVDAFDAEPPEITALLRHPRVIATPHLGGYTHSSIRRSTTQAVENLLHALDQG